jgi:hypothetical protein
MLLTAAKGIDWVSISSLATAGGTLVLAVATFASVRSANRAARAAERSLLAGLRPVLIPSRDDDPAERVMFGEGHRVTVAGHGGVIDVSDDRIYMAISLRNAGAGLAVLHGWRVSVPDTSGARLERPDPEDFTRQLRDLYIPDGELGFWQGAIRDRSHPQFDAIVAALDSGDRVMVDLLYSDYEGGQRTVARFGVTVNEEGSGRSANVLRYWNLDRADPR